MLVADARRCERGDLSGSGATAILAVFRAAVPVGAPTNGRTATTRNSCRRLDFNYESDLDRVALAIQRQPQSSLAFAVVEGRFDRKKIEEFAGKYGSLKTADGKTLFAVPLSGSNRKVYFTFLREDRIAWANDSSFFFQQPRSDATEHGANIFYGWRGRRSSRCCGRIGSGGGIVVAGSRWIAFTAIGGAPGAAGLDFDQRETGWQFTARGEWKAIAWRKRRSTS